MNDVTDACGRRPGSGGGSCALTAGVDAGVADRFVLVAGRVFLQLLQDFFHRWVPSEAGPGQRAGLSVLILR